jgi:hypothetical protein
MSEETVIDYLIGFARLADPEEVSFSIALERDFSFDETCRYGALAAGSDQVKAVTEYERKGRSVGLLPALYPLATSLPGPSPVARFETPSGDLEVGARIHRASELHAVLAGRKRGESTHPSAK